LITIVARFKPTILGVQILAMNTITAPRHKAGISASVSRVRITIITSLSTSLHMTVTTGSRRTIIQTGIRLNLISIVATFNTSLDMTVTAGRRRAIVEARIGLILVTIVALLARLNDAIAADLIHTIPLETSLVGRRAIHRIGIGGTLGVADQYLIIIGTTPLERRADLV
jgi:hypothetical protein